MRFLNLFCIITIASFLRCGVPDITHSGGSGTETVGMTGVLVDEHGVLAPGTQVSLYSYDSQSVTSSVKDTLTDGTGTYTFPNISSGMYSIIGTTPDNKKAVCIGPLFYDSLRDSLRMVGYDTLFSPGAVRGCVNPQKPEAGILAYIPGTSFLAITDDYGNYLLAGVPRGVYNVYYSTSGYLTGKDTAVVILPDIVTTLQCVTLRVDPDGAPPSPELKSLLHDEVNGTVQVIWNRVHVDDLSGYLLYRDSSDIPVLIGTTDDTSFSDMLFGSRDTLPKWVTYRVASVDTLRNQSLYSNSLSLYADPPLYFKTIFSWSIATLQGRTDTLTNADSLAISVSFSNRNRSNSRIRLAAGQPGNIVEERVVDACCGVELFILQWKDPGSLDLFISALDHEGGEWEDSISVSIMDTLLLYSRNKWMSAEPLTTPRRFASAVATDSAIYVAGGCAQVFDPGLGYTTVALATVEMLGRSGVWTSAPSLPQGRFYSGMAELHGTLYLIGGCDFQNNFSSILSFRPSLDNEWREVAQLPFSCSGVACCRVDEKIFIFGGVQSSVSGRSITDSIYVFDPAVSTITGIGTLSIPRAYHQAVYLDSNVYILGGLGGSYDLTLAEALSSVEMFDIEIKRSYPGANMAATRLNFAAGSLNGELFVAGGFGSAVSNQVLTGVERFNPAEEIWTSKAELPYPCHGMAAVTFKNAFFTIGGAQNGYPGLDATTSVKMYYP